MVADGDDHGGAMSFWVVRISCVAHLDVTVTLCGRGLFLRTTVTLLLFFTLLHRKRCPLLHQRTPLVFWPARVQEMVKDYLIPCP